MTLEKLFSYVMTLMFGTDNDKAEYRDYFINTANTIMAELFDVNNALRATDGRKPLKNIPEFNKDDTNVWDEEIPYEPKILRTILPYGVAGYIYTDDDKAIGTDYKNKYEYAKSQVLAVSLVSIVDVYDETPDEIPILVDDKWSLAEEENNG